jgi:hypothetical protein
MIYGLKIGNRLIAFSKRGYWLKKKLPQGRQLFLELLTLEIISVLRSPLLYPCAR